MGSSRVEMWLYDRPVITPLVAIVHGTLFSLYLIATGVMFPDQVPAGYTSADQLTGQALMMVAITTYIILALPLTQRRSMRHAGSLFNEGVILPRPETWLRPLPWRELLIGLLFGFLYALFANTPIGILLNIGSVDPVIRAAVIGQVLLWLWVGFALAMRIMIALRFFEQGKAARIDLFNIRALEPFARNGRDDLLLIVGALVMTTLQSLDASFRLYNYSTALLVVLPAALFLLWVPMWSVHRWLVRKKGEQLEQIEHLIARAPRDVNVPAMTELEALLQRRSRLRDTSTWPMDLSFASRLVFYVFIPPLAWAGAALVEIGVDKLLGD